MAKKGLDISTIQAVLKDVQINLGWSLCIGAVMIPSGSGQGRI